MKDSNSVKMTPVENAPFCGVGTKPIVGDIECRCVPDRPSRAFPTAARGLALELINAIGQELSFTSVDLEYLAAVLDGYSAGKVEFLIDDEFSRFLINCRLTELEVEVVDTVVRHYARSEEVHAAM